MLPYLGYPYVSKCFPFTFVLLLFILCFFSACFASLRSILVVELLGLERLTNAFGLLLLFQGIAACIGAPMAGEFFNATGSYDYSFYLSGSLILASAVICYPLNMINRWEKRRLGVVQQKAVPV